MKEFTLAEVAEHKTHEDLYIVIRDEVYEITKFVAEHPGGEEVLIEYGGKDSTEQFDDVGHSNDAKDILKQFHIGTIIESERASTREAKKKEAKEAKKLLIIALSGVAIGVGLVILFKFVNSR